MSLLIESIKVAQGQVYNLDLHQQRVHETRIAFFGEAAVEQPLTLTDYIKIPEYAQQGIYKCRIVYAWFVEKLSFTPYEIHPVQSLQVVRDDHIYYRYKMEDRSRIQSLFDQRGDSEDIIIVKNGWVTDASYANLVFWDGHRFLTPDTPLLNGIRRQRLLHSDVIREIPIREEDLSSFHSVHLINAFLDIGDVEVEDVRY